jgi:hypothetical protein
MSPQEKLMVFYIIRTAICADAGEGGLEFSEHSAVEYDILADRPRLSQDKFFRKWSAKDIFNEAKKYWPLISSVTHTKQFPYIIWAGWLDSNGATMTISLDDYNGFGPYKDIVKKIYNEIIFINPNKQQSDFCPATTAPVLLGIDHIVNEDNGPIYTIAHELQHQHQVKTGKLYHTYNQISWNNSPCQHLTGIDYLNSPQEMDANVAATKVVATIRNIPFDGIIKPVVKTSL